MEFYSNASYFCHVVPPPPPPPTPPPIEMEEPPTPPFYREPGKFVWQLWVINSSCWSHNWQQVHLLFTIFRWPRFIRNTIIRNSFLIEDLLHMLNLLQKGDDFT